MTVADQDSNLPDLQALWDYNDPAGTESKFRAVLAKVAALDDQSHHADLLTQIARAQGLQRQFDEAHQTLDQAEAMIADNMHRARVRSWLERGRVFNSSGSKDKAKPLFIKAWVLATGEHFDRLAVDAAHMLGVIEPADEALRWNEQALDLAENSSNEAAQRWRGALYNNIGWTHHDCGDYEQALPVFRKALTWRQQQNQALDLAATLCYS